MGYRCDGDNLGCMNNTDVFCFECQKAICRVHQYCRDLNTGKWSCYECWLEKKEK